MLRHEIDSLGRRLFRRDDKVALILAVLVIRDDQELPAPESLDTRFNCIKAVRL
jgi:hypothetical protein